MLVALITMCSSASARAQAEFGRTQNQQGQASQPSVAEAELQTGISLTQRGQFNDAIPHFLAARGHISNQFAAEFNLALCYVATNQSKQAIKILTDLRDGGHSTADVNNLLAQAYIGNGQSQEAFDAFEHAATLTPESEKLYVLVADACMEHQDYRLGAKVADMGLQKIPTSARLLYQRGMFLSFLDRSDLAVADLERASKLAPDSDIAYLAAGQKHMLDGDMEGAIRVAREGIKKGHAEDALFTILGVALVHSGVTPGEPEFAEAQAALEKSVAGHPRDASAQATLGKLYFAAGRFDEAIAHLEIARTLDPRNKAVYSQLALAYRRQGKIQQAQSVLAVLAKLNEEEAATIREAPPERKGVYGAKATDQKTPEPQH